MYSRCFKGRTVSDWFSLFCIQDVCIMIKFPVQQACVGSKIHCCCVYRKVVNFWPTATYPAVMGQVGLGSAEPLADR